MINVIEMLEVDVQFYVVRHTLQFRRKQRQPNQRSCSRDLQ